MEYIQNIIKNNGLTISEEELEEIIEYNRSFNFSIFESLNNLGFDYNSIKLIMEYYTKKEP